ncbi:MAG TPA: class I SAM-dependent methyltransferase [Mycobacteriales bacterium]|nr:class I SAM-dependent methyltransferase [Mycobacteriales bacterium]
MTDDARPEAGLREFEEIYASVGADLTRIPWAHLQPNPTLLSWLGRYDPAPGRALVIACGLGDDAEELARRGHRVTAFDLSPTAIGWCRRRFPASTVDYRVADLLELPASWSRRYDLVVEIATLQSLPPAQRRAGMAAVAATVRPRGRLLVRCLVREDDEPAPSRPWPLSRSELAAFVDEGLREIETRDVPRTADGERRIELTYERPPD